MTSLKLSEAEQATLDAVLAGNGRQAARLISRIEASDPTIAPLIAALGERRRDTVVVGITGPPGAGKSTLLNALIGQLRMSNLRVAVLAIDPSSPFTGGAILGDRVRMARHGADQGVFIRSMASRANLGGMAAAAGDALTVLAAMDFDWIFIETVGVGQNEVDIVNHADTVVVVVTPHSGDAVQAVKAGVLEIGDIYLVNKADTGGVERTLAGLREALHRGRGPHQWRQPILGVQATNADGLEAVVEALARHGDYLGDHPEEFFERRRRQTHARLKALIFAELQQRLDKPGAVRDLLEHWAGEIVEKRSDPRTAAVAILKCLDITDA